MFMGMEDVRIIPPPPARAPAPGTPPMNVPDTCPSAPAPLLLVIMPGARPCPAPPPPPPPIIPLPVIIAPGPPLIAIGDPPCMDDITPPPPTLLGLSIGGADLVAKSCGGCPRLVETGAADETVGPGGAGNPWKAGNGGEGEPESGGVASAGESGAGLCGVHKGDGDGAELRARMAEVRYKTRQSSPVCSGSSLFASSFFFFSNSQKNGIVWW